MSIKILKIDLSVDFSNKIVELIKENTKKYEKVVFISPNRRLMRFVEKGLGIDELLETEMFTIEEFAQNLNIDFLDDVRKIHSDIERNIFFLEMIKDNLPDFYKKLGNSDANVFVWAKRLSKLFDDIDRQLLCEKVSNFQYVDAVEPVSEILENLKTLYAVYDREYNFLFGGKFFKNAVSITEHKPFQHKYKNTPFVFGGLVFLSNSEKKIIKNISQFTDIYFAVPSDLKKRDVIVVDGQSYEFGNFEAVDKIVNDLNSLEKTEIVEICGKSREFNADFYEFSNTHIEASFIAGKMRGVIENSNKKDNPEYLAVVLPNSSSLFPLLGFLDKKDDLPLNITMGYPFGHTDVGLFYDSLLKLIVDIERKYAVSKRYAADSTILLQFLNTTVSGLLKSEFGMDELNSSLFECECGCLIYEFEDKDALFEKIIKPFLDAKNFDMLHRAFLNLFDCFDKDLINSTQYRFTAQMIQMFYARVVGKIKTIKGSIDLSALFVYHFIKDIADGLSVPFEGYPLRGAQIMGALEARMLGFENLIIADVNEGVLPSVDKLDPLLPEDIKNQIGLASYREREMLEKYYFFRLVYSSKNVFVLYKSSSGTDSEKKSRFVEQLMLMQEIKKKKKIAPTVEHIGFPVFEKKLVGIDKNDEFCRHIESVIESNKLSPSSLDLYMSCPYKYYLEKVKNIKKRVLFDKDFEADKVGTLIHFFLEKGFGPFLNSAVDRNIYLKIKNAVIKQIGSIAKNSSIKGLKDDVAVYLNRLSDFQFDALKLIAAHRIENFFSVTLKDFEEFELLGVEEKLYLREFGIYGFADRIDKLKDNIRIIDYKTGLYTHFPKPKKLKNLIENDGFDWCEFNKDKLEKVRDAVGSVQMPVYILMGMEKFKKQKGVDAVVYRISAKRYNMIKMVKGDDVESYKKVVRYIINHMNKCSKIYALKGDVCKFCEFRHFCRFV